MPDKGNKLFNLVNITFYKHTLVVHCANKYVYCFGDILNSKGRGIHSQNFLNLNSLCVKYGTFILSFTYLHNKISIILKKLPYLGFVVSSQTTHVACPKASVYRSLLQRVLSTLNLYTIDKIK